MIETPLPEKLAERLKKRAAEKMVKRHRARREVSGMPVKSVLLTRASSRRLTAENWNDLQEASTMEARNASRPWRIFQSLESRPFSAQMSVRCTAEAAMSSLAVLCAMRSSMRI